MVESFFVGSLVTRYVLFLNYTLSHFLIFNEMCVDYCLSRRWRAWEVLHFFITTHKQGKYNRACYALYISAFDGLYRYIHIFISFTTLNAFSIICAMRSFSRYCISCGWCKIGCTKTCLWYEKVCALLLKEAVSRLLLMPMHTTILSKM